MNQTALLTFSKNNKKIANEIEDKIPIYYYYIKRKN